MGEIINWPDGAIPEKWIESLFEKMVAYYGSKFADQWRGSDPVSLKKIWAIELGKLSREELKRGVDNLINQEWCPTLPQFVKLCVAPSIDYTVAYYEAIAGLQERGKGEMGQWSHRAVYWAAALLKQDLGMQTHAAIKSRWEAALKAQFERTEWPEIPQPRLELTAPGDGKLSKEEAKRMVKQLGADGIIKNVNDAGGHLRWATKIIDRVAAGESVPSASVKAAQEALGKLANNTEQDIAESQKVG